MTELSAGRDTPVADVQTPRPASKEQRVIYRHTLWVRSWHWINVIALTILLMTGLQIFNAHPALNWGQTSNFDHALLSIGAVDLGGGKLKGVTTVLGHPYTTTGVLGASKGSDGAFQDIGFPGWSTIPGFRDLGTGRQWHFFFAWLFVANGIVFVAYTIWSRHLKRDLWPSVADLKTIPASIWEHVRLKHAEGGAAARYNVLQKLAYLIVLYGLLPLMILTGLTMSPGMDAAFPILPWAFGGRQSARTLHFLSASGLVLFFLIHIFEVVAAGFFNEMRSIITGRFAIKTHGAVETHGTVSPTVEGAAE